jgi:hypothetical protein
MRRIHGGDLLGGRFTLGSLKVNTLKKARLLNSRAVKREVGSTAAAKLRVLFPNSDPVAKIFPEGRAFFYAKFACTNEAADVRAARIGFPTSARSFSLDQLGDPFYWIITSR